MLKKNKGITLIALVVTIIVLLILAGVTLSLVAGENGILKRATNAVDVNEKESAKVEVSLKITEYQTEYYEKKYLNQEAKLEMSIGEWIYETYGGTNETENYIFTIKLPSTGEPTEENPYVITINKNDKLNSNITGTLTTNGKLSWDSDTKEPSQEEPSNSKIDQELKDLLEVGKIEITVENILDNPEIADKILDSYGVTTKEELLQSDKTLEEVLDTAKIDEIKIEDILDSEELLNKIFSNNDVTEYLKQPENKEVFDKLTSTENAKDILKETNKPLYYETQRVTLNFVPSAHNTGTVEDSDGVYTLKGLASLESQEIMNLTNFTIYLEAKDLVCYYNGSSTDTSTKTFGTIFGMGTSAAGAENKQLGMGFWGDKRLTAYSGTGGLGKIGYGLLGEDWNKLAMTYDGNKLRLFINGSEVWTYGSAKTFGTNFYIGGLPDAPYYRSPSYVALVNGSYRNIKVYNIAIDPSEL